MRDEQPFVLRADAEEAALAELAADARSDSCRQRIDPESTEVQLGHADLDGETLACDSR